MTSEECLIHKTFWLLQHVILYYGNNYIYNNIIMTIKYAILRRLCLVKNIPSQEGHSTVKVPSTRETMFQYPHVSQLFILTCLAKPGYPGAASDSRPTRACMEKLTLNQ